MEPSTTERLWKKVWHPDSIPKVNSFTEILLHNNILTAENLRKRGILGPSRCALCNSVEETSSHIFLQCKVSLIVWRIVLPSEFGRDLPGTAVQLFKDWSNHFPDSLRKKPILSRLWASIPKNLCWQLWLARNRAIFKEKKEIPTNIAAKTIGMIVEKFASNNISFPSQESIPEPYFSWCKNFLKERSSLQSNSIIGRVSHPRWSLPWEIRLSSNEFKSWFRKKNSFAFFFDGASKGNPGVVGAGEILLIPEDM